MRRNSLGQALGPAPYDPRSYDERQLHGYLPEAEIDEMDSALMFSKKSDEWATPQALFDELNKEFEFDWDVAASGWNAKVDHWFGPDHVDPMSRDALAVRWGAWVAGPCWMNPPYSRCAEFIAKAADESRNGCTVVCLIPSRTDTRYWHEHIWDREQHKPRLGVEVRFIKGRLKFGNAESGAPFPSVVVVFRPIVPQPVEAR